MEAAFGLPIQSPADDWRQVDHPASTSAHHPPPRPPSPPTPLQQLRRTSLRPRTAAEPEPAPAPAPAPDARIEAGRAESRARDTSAAADAVASGPAAANSGGSLRELKLRWAAGRQTPEADRPFVAAARGPHAGRPKKRTSPHAVAKPLLPVTERKTADDHKTSRRAKRDAPDADKWDIAPDGSSAGREGRQFTVANVGNNGRIYLRPTVRPAHLRFPQPSFVFPMTPPGTAGLDVLVPDKDRRKDQPRKSQQQQQQQQQNEKQDPQQDATYTFYGSDWTADEAPSPTSLPMAGTRFHVNTTRAGAVRPTTAGAGGARPPGGHRRAISDSTVHDPSIARESEPGGFKIVITQPLDEQQQQQQQRARTLEDLDPSHGHHVAVPHLEVAIPSWKLGTPRFTLRGTPIFRGSSYAPTEEAQSSRPSYFSPMFDHAHSHLREDDESPPPQDSRQDSAGRVSAPAPEILPALAGGEEPERGMRTTYHSNYAAVVPAIFDALTFKPACDDRSIVRFSPATGAITAATPPRLVAEITSPKFMDYDLVSDFFLTYRSFLDPHDLLRMLVVRLRWAVARDDEAGMVVRVRTFVALRHWILNYFMDDFVIDYGLRTLFCTLLNSFVDELSQDPRGRKVQLKILTELKKCWRRSCAQYWDGAEFDDMLGPEAPIAPGGIAGHRNPALDPSFWELVASAGGLPGGENMGYSDSLGNDHGDEDINFLTHLQDPESMVDPQPGSSFDAAGARTGHIDSIVLGNDRPSTPENRPSENSERRQASPVSITSLDFVSCSFPTKNMRMLQTGMDHPLGAHPVEAYLSHGGSSLIATTPRALVGKRVRPGPSDGLKPSTSHASQHRRNNSLTDSLRERAATAERLLQKNPDLLMSLPYAGSLVRGAIFPPGQPYVEVLPPGTSGGVCRQTTIVQSFPVEHLDMQKDKASAMSGQGMRKLLGSVRRALSTRGQTVSPTQGNFINISPLGPRGATTNRLPGTAIVPQARPRTNGTRPPVRIDLLGAKIAEDFKVAVREDASIDVEAPPEMGDEHPPPFSEQQRADPQAPMSTSSGSLFLGWAPGGEDGMGRPISDTGITSRSKSIVIIDDTLKMDVPARTISMVGGSREPRGGFGEMLLSVAADPTPPTTPPGQPVGTPRRLSYLLDPQLDALPSRPPGSIPPFVPDGGTVGRSMTGLASPPTVDPSILSSSLSKQPRVDSMMLPRYSIDEGQDSMSTDTLRRPTNSFGMPSFPPVRMSRPSWIQDHSRQRSSRSHKSSQSYGQKRLASFRSGTGLPPHARRQSFHGSTFTDASGDAVSEAPMPQPLRVLRRRPGGDLRAVTHVGDLDQGPLRRSRSAGSLATCTDSIRSSSMHRRTRGSGGFVDVVSVDFSRDKEAGATFSVGMLANKKPNKRLSLFSTHSSKPAMRPSFEAEAQKLAQIPDDVDDDGGVESALLKLEGKFERKPKKLSFSEPMPFITPLLPSVTAAGAGLEAAEATAGPVMTARLSGFLPPQALQDQQHLTAEEKLDHRHRHILNSDLAPSYPLSTAKLGQSGARTTATTESHDAAEPVDDAFGTRSMAASSSAAPPHHGKVDASSFLSESSGNSYSSIPLLDRGLTDDGRSRGAPTDEWGGQSVFADVSESGMRTPTAAGVAAAATVGTQGRDRGSDQSSSYVMIDKTESMEKMRPGETMPHSPRQGTEVSFFDDHSDGGASDLSSELSAELVDEDDAHDVFGRDPIGLARSHGVAPSLSVHPLGDPQREPVRSPPVSFQEQHPGRLVEDPPKGSRPPSPPITLVQALQMAPDTANIPELHDHQLWEDKPLPPTPSLDGGPAAAAAAAATAAAAAAAAATQRGEAARRNGPSASERAEGMRHLSVHLPFVLAFESEMLAQQFTLIEKDALHEIDWKELIEMRWKNAENSDARSWVGFLRNTDARGVEVVIARFNIMVKWAISEVVLTQEVEERARCIIKFIHVAAHCRRYRNFATMSQLAIALSSNEVARLGKTWGLVPPGDVRTLRELEALVSPTRNFYNLRAEMEAVDIGNADAGCIPFVGIYTHDLLFNAQRPSEIASSPTTAPLVNFERCRVAASIVKTLLRLVEASALYAFQPIEGVTERCLWMSALTDDEIRRFSEALE